MPGYSLDNVTIDGFRGLRNFRLDDLGWINILVGPNNSGKTSVLEAFSILCNPMEPFEWVSMVHRRDFGLLDETRIQSLRWCFTQSGQLAEPEAMFEGECKMSCKGRFPLRNLRVTYKDIVGEPGLELKRYLRRRAGLRLKPHGTRRQPETDLLDTEPSRGAELTHSIEWEPSDSRFPKPEGTPIVLQVWEDLPIFAERRRPSPQRVPTETLTPYSYQLNSLQVRRQTRRIVHDQQGLVVDLVRVFDPDVTDIELASFRGARAAIYLKHRRLGPAPLSVFGDGLRRAVLLAATLPNLKDGGILLIDEIETGIHVSALTRVFAWLVKAARDLGVQIVVATHSLEAVDAIMLSIQDKIDELVTFHMHQTEQETRVKRIYGDLLLRIRSERGLDVR